MVSRAFKVFFSIIFSMAAHLLLGMAANSNPLNFEIHSVNIKLDCTNFSLWCNTIIYALETFDLKSFTLLPNSPSKTIIVPPADAEDGDPTIQANLDFIFLKKKDHLELLWIKSTLSDNSLSIVD